MSIWVHGLLGLGQALNPTAVLVSKGGPEMVPAVQATDHVKVTIKDQMTSRAPCPLCYEFP